MSLPAVYANPSLTHPERPLPGRVAIVGAGTIGPDIGYYLKSALPDLELVLVDVAERALEEARARLAGYSAKAVARGQITPELAARLDARIVTSTRYDVITGSDWVIEAATENLPLKRRIFSDIEARVGPAVPITSNTSSLPARHLFGHLEHPERATVTHFFAPAWRSLAVEVIQWSSLDPQLLDWLRWVFFHTGKVPLLTTDVPAFMLDRVFDNWCNDAALLLEIATAAEIDSVASEFVSAGPFYVLNLTQGNAIVTAANTLQSEEGGHYLPASILRSVKTWSTVAPGQRIEVDPIVADRVRAQLLGVLWSQSFDILDRGIASAADLELGCELALGFSRGPLALAASEDAARILTRYSEWRPGMPLPQRPLAEYQRFRRDLLVDEFEGVVVITLRRPAALNAIDDRLTDEMLEVIRSHEAEALGFVIVGYGTKAFSAGADIGRFPEVLGDARAAEAYARRCARLLTHLDHVERPVVAALNGLTLGGGLELAMRCHALVAVRGATLQFPEVTLGLAPGLGGMVIPYRRWPGAALVFHDMIVSGTRIGAERAHELGILHGLADGYSELVSLAVATVFELGYAPPRPQGPVDVGEVRPVVNPSLSREVVALLRAGVAEGAAAASWEEALEVGYRTFAATAATAAAAEGVEAFLARRKPDFGKTG